MPFATPRRAGLLVLAGAVALVLVVVLVGTATSLKGTDPGYVCVVQEGGPFDGRGVKEVRQPSEAVKPIGIWNKQRCFPATERNYVLSANPAEADSGTVDLVEVPTADAVTVRVEGQALFTLNRSPDVVADFYRRFGVRTYGDLAVGDDRDRWWTEGFLKVQFRPTLVSTLREVINGFTCVQLNSACVYVQNPDEAVSGGTQVEDSNNNQNLAKAQQAMSQRLTQQLNAVLGGPFLENVRFQNLAIKFNEQQQAAINAAQTKRTEVATARLEAQKGVETAKGAAQRRIEEAKGDRQAAFQRSKAIQSTGRAYRANPAQAEIDKLKALCGDDGCDPQVLGSDGVIPQLGTRTTPAR